MSIIRVAERPRYTRISNHVFSDHRLSFKAVGVLCQLLSYPDNWKVNAKHLSTTHTDGQTAVRSALKELKECGYLRKYPVKDELGRISYWESVIFEFPLEEETQNVENPHCGESSCGKPERLINTYSNQELIEQELSVCSEEDEQPTHTPAESSDQGKGIQVNETETQKVKTPSPVKHSHTEVEPISVSEQSSLENNSAGARENFAPSVAKNAPESVEATESVQSIAEPAKAAYSSNSAGVMNLSKFMQVYNACRGNWKPLSVAPPPVVVEGISSYRNRFDGTDEEFFQFFPLLVKAAQSSGGWLAGSRNPSQIFSVERLPLTDVWSDALQAKQPAPAPAKPIEVSPDFSLKSFID